MNIYKETTLGVATMMLSKYAVPLYRCKEIIKSQIIKNGFSEQEAEEIISEALNKIRKECDYLNSLSDEEIKARRDKHMSQFLNSEGLDALIELIIKR